MIKFTKDEAYIFGYIITMRMMNLTDDKDIDVRHTGEQNDELSILSWQRITRVRSDLILLWK